MGMDAHRRVERGGRRVHPRPGACGRGVIPLVGIGLAEENLASPILSRAGVIRAALQKIALVLTLFPTRYSPPSTIPLSSIYERLRIHSPQTQASREKKKQEKADLRLDRLVALRTGYRGHADCGESRNADGAHRTGWTAAALPLDAH